MKEQNVALMVTCLADMFRPAVTKSCINLLHRYCRIKPIINKKVICCGQPGYTNGYIDDAQKVAINNISLLENYDAVVVPSASCAGMIKYHYEELCGDKHKASIKRLSAKTYELTEFISKHKITHAVSKPDINIPPIIYHDNCAALREMRIDNKPHALLKEYTNIQVTPLNNKQVCCGFGGTFFLKYPHLASRMAHDKIKDAIDVSPKASATGNNISSIIFTSTDLGCLLHLSRHAHKYRSKIYFYHISEILSSAWCKIAPIGRARKPAFKISRC